MVAYTQVSQWHQQQCKVQSKPGEGIGENISRVGINRDRIVQPPGLSWTKNWKLRLARRADVCKEGTTGFASPEAWSESAGLGNRDWPRGYQQHHPYGTHRTICSHLQPFAIWLGHNRHPISSTSRDHITPTTAPPYQNTIKTWRDRTRPKLHAIPPSCPN